MSELSTYSLIKSDFVGVCVEYNTVVKRFSDGSIHIRYNSYSNLKGKGCSSLHNGSSSLEDLQRYNSINLIRRRQAISDLAYENGCIAPWQYFVTLTFDDKFVEDSYSHEKVTKYLHRWLDNQKHQNPNMRYILVPELHKSGRIHFHGVFSSVPNWVLEKAFDKNKGCFIKINGSQIYNLTNYKLGFTTVSLVKNIDAVSHYISKYITKELLNLHNKKNYWHSKNLVKPKKNYYLSNKEEIINFVDSNRLNVNYVLGNTYGNFEKLYISASSDNS